MDQFNQFLTQQAQQLDRLSGTALALAAILSIGWLLVWSSLVYAVHRFITALDEKWKAERVEEALRTDAARLNAPFKTDR
jgi:hypothetical protein